MQQRHLDVSSEKRGAGGCKGLQGLREGTIIGGRGAFNKEEGFRRARKDVSNANGLPNIIIADSSVSQLPQFNDLTVKPPSFTFSLDFNSILGTTSRLARPPSEKKRLLARKELPGMLCSLYDSLINSLPREYLNF